jgi:flagellar basal body-associated protein FliL
MATYPSPDNKPAKGFGKRSLKQWIIIYVILAIIVYALVYFVFIHKSTSTGGGLGY